ncbi:diguanylate cyclase domain-containing protein [Streptomyces sp. NPDC001212]
MLRTGRRSAVHVLLLEDNGFKGINDTYGCAAGDAVIYTMGQRLARWSAGRQAFAPGWRRRICRRSGAAFVVRPGGHRRTARPAATAPPPRRADPAVDVLIGIARAAASLPGETTARSRSRAGPGRPGWSRRGRGACRSRA